MNVVIKKIPLALPPAPVTIITTADFTISSRVRLESAFIDSTLYMTDGRRTWELREILPMTAPPAN